MRVCQTQSLAGLSVYSDFPIQKLLRLQLLINTQTTRQAGGRGGGGERRHILIHAHTENIWHTHTQSVTSAFANLKTVTHLRKK